MRMRSDGSLRVGVTGGIGSGKSEVCRLFERLGRTVIRADEVARELIDHDAEIRREIEHAFGKMYQADGHLDRKSMAAVVFGNRRRVMDLNRIVHPRVIREIDRQILGLNPAAARPYVVVEAALIFESGFHRDLDYTIVVTTREELAISRVEARDGLTPEQVQQRIRAQMPQSRKISLADFVVGNEDSLDSLSVRISFLDRLLSRLARGCS